MKALIFILISFLSLGVLAQEEESVAPNPKNVSGIEEKAKPTSHTIIYTLDEVVKKSVELSPMVTSSEFTLEQAEALYEKAKRSAILPKIDLNVFGGMVPDSPDNSGPDFNFPDTGQFEIRSWGPFFRLQLEALQPIYTFGKIKNLQDAAKSGVEAGKEEIKKTTNEIILQAYRAYYTLANLHSYLEFITELQDRADKAQEIVSQKIKKNSTEVTDIDLMRIEVFQAETQRRKIEILHNVDFLKMTIKILMGLPRHFDIDIADKKIRMDDISVEPVEEFLKQAKDHRPEMKQLEYLVKAKDSLRLEKKSQLFPSVGLGAEYRYGFAPGREKIRNPFLVNNFNMYSIGAAVFLTQSLSFHVMDSDLKRARADHEKAKADLQAGFQGIEFQIRRAHKEVMAKSESFEHSKQAFKKVRSWVLATTLNFGVGVVPPKELVEAFVAYSQVKNDYLGTLYDYRIAQAMLLYTTGTLH